MLAMAKTKSVGRPRKEGPRYPGGKRKPELRESGIAPAMVAHMVRVLAEKAGDPAMETPLGWLRLHGILNDRQCAAGMSYARIREEYISLNGLPGPFPSPVGFEISHGRGESTEKSEKGAKRAAARYNTAVAAAGGTLEVRNLLDSVCVYRNHPSAWELTALIKCLDYLADHASLTRESK